MVRTSTKEAAELLQQAQNQIVLALQATQSTEEAAGHDACAGQAIHLLQAALGILAKDTGATSSPLIPVDPKTSGAFGATVRQRRAQAGLSQRRLASRAGLSDRTIKNVEAG